MCIRDSSATSFYGDGSSLTGVAAAGIGTALSAEKTNVLSNIFYTNQSYTIGVSTTIDPPASGSLGYSQASEIIVSDSVDLTVADGDVFMVDVLGISTDPTGGGTVDNNYLFSTVYADNITNQAGTGAPDASQGFKISKTTESTNSITGALIVSGGVGIAKSLHVGGYVSVGGTLTYEDVTNVDVVGLATYRSGAKFGVAGVGGTITGTGNATITGIVTASGFKGSGANLTALNADNISSGIVTSARLGGGSASASTYLQGDGQWGSISAGGLTEVDMWVQSTNGGSTGDFNNDVFLSGDDARVPTGARAASNFTKVGDGMSVSSGIWTFPSTGTWEIFVHYAYDGSATGELQLKNWFSTNSGGAWTLMNHDYYIVHASAKEETYTISGFFTVSDASTARFKTTIYNTMNHSGLKGGSDPYNSYITFKKLG